VTADAIPPAGVHRFAANLVFVSASSPITPSISTTKPCDTELIPVCLSEHFTDGSPRSACTSAKEEKGIPTVHVAASRDDLTTQRKPNGHQPAPE
jgi:hypothetical protein